MSKMFHSTNEFASMAGDLGTTLTGALGRVGRQPISISHLSETRGQPRSVCSLQIRYLIAERRRRDDFFEANLFADPAWDMLLELYATQLEQRRISITNLCQSAAVPPTTALRWIKTLEDQGLISKQHDRLDARRVFISLSTQGATLMAAYFQGQT